MGKEEYSTEIEGNFIPYSICVIHVTSVSKHLFMQIGERDTPEIRETSKRESVLRCFINRQSKHMRGIAEVIG